MVFFKKFIRISHKTSILNYGKNDMVENLMLKKKKEKKKLEKYIRIQKQQKLFVEYALNFIINNDLRKRQQ